MLHVSTRELLDDFELIKDKKWIDKITDKVKEIIFWNDLNDTNIKEFESFIRLFTSLYYLMKEFFNKKVRKISWERYFEHLRWVVYNVLELPNPNIEKIYSAIAHDTIEDIEEMNFDILKIYWYKTAISVQALSKEPHENFLDWTNTKQEAIEKRNHEYFSHLESFENMKKHINSIALSKWIELDKEELNEITQNTLDVKFADRIHNLSTQWHPDDIDTVNRKIEETKKYFLKVAEKTNPEAYERLKSEIFKLEKQVENVNWKVEWIITK